MLQKPRFVYILGVIMLCLWLPLTASSHYHTYWPKKPGCYGQPGEVVTWQYFWGHPFEMLISDAPPPKFFIRTPAGQKENVKLKEITLTDQESGKDRRAYEVEYRPSSPGDYYLCLEGQPQFIPEENILWQDYVKAVWHVVAEKGWDKPVGLDFEIIPLTRPYGWPTGSLFNAQARFMGKPLKGAAVEVEKFNGFFVPQDKMPKDLTGADNVPLITRVTKTDVNGYLSCTLDSPGWWIITVVHPHGKKNWQGKTYPLERRASLWVYLEPSPPSVK